jgi:hypothetical protein
VAKSREEGKEFRLEVAKVGSGEVRITRSKVYKEVLPSMGKNCQII